MILASDSLVHVELLQLAARPQHARGYDQRSDLHAAVLAESGQDEELVDEAVLEFCHAENDRCWPEKAFPNLPY